ncbi:MAG: hypothetical protein SGPRY_005335, partial [Prymnesium sp.]
KEQRGEGLERLDGNVHLEAQPEERLDQQVRIHLGERMDQSEEAESGGGRVRGREAHELAFIEPETGRREVRGGGRAIRRDEERGVRSGERNGRAGERSNGEWGRCKME